MILRPRQDARTNLICRVYTIMLGAYPRAFRIEFGHEMRQVFRDRYRAATASNELLRFGGLVLWDWLRSCVRERLDAR